MAQANTFAGTFHQTRDIRQNEFIAESAFYHAQIGGQCSKVVVCDLGVCVCYHGQQCGFPNVGETDQTNVCDQFQFQNDIVFFGFSAGFCVSGSLSCGGCEVLIALAAFTAVDQNFFFVGFCNVGHNLAAFCFTDHCTHGYFDDDIFAVFAEAVTFAAGFTGGCSKFSFITEVHQCIHAAFANENYVAAFAAVTAVGAAVGDVFCSVKGNLAVAAVAAFYVDLDSIYKHCFLSFPLLKEDFTALQPEGCKPVKPSSFIEID